MSLIGDAIKQERKRVGMTSKALAQAVTLTPQYIRLIECGGAIPAMETVFRIANVFPDADTGLWLWLLLRDLWGDPIFEVMWQYALEAGRAGALASTSAPVHVLKLDARGGTA